MKTLGEELYKIKRLMESMDAMSMATMPQEKEYSDLEKLKSMTWDQLIVEPQNEQSPVKIKIDVPWESNISEGINVHVILTPNELYQLDIFLAKSLQGLGLGYKIYKAMVLNFGHIYSGEGRRHNKTHIPRILEKLASEPEIERYDNDKGTLLVYSHLDNKEDLIKRFNGQ